MAFWMLLTLMTVVALGAVVWPFMVRNQPDSGGSEIAVYKDQLAEIDRDLQAGMIEVEQAHAARIEVSRRLLQAADESAHPVQPAGLNFRARGLSTLAIALVFLPAIAGSLYARLGSPDAASIENVAEPLRPDPDDTAVEAMVSQVENHLKESPNDGRGWEALAPIYMRMGRYDEAVRAWQHSIAALGDNVEREENLGESFIAAANGLVTGEARAAFDKARSMDPENVPARFYAGLAAKQDGQRDEAARIWRDLVATAPRGAEWVETVRNALARLDEATSAPADASGGSASTEHKDATVQAMVDRLAERLEREGGDPDRWFMLVRSYETLGEHDKAVAAVARARLAFASDPEKLTSFGRLLSGADGPSNEESASGGVAGPRTQDRAALGSYATDQQMTMIRGMVDRLAERLKQDGRDADGWAQLIRSYVALGERDQAVAAARSARAALSKDENGLGRIDATAAEFGISPR